MSKDDLIRRTKCKFIDYLMKPKDRAQAQRVTLCLSRKKHRKV